MNRLNCDGAIFDMDGVLIDVSQSFRIAIKKTVNFYLKQNGLKIRAKKEDVNVIKLVPGINNDWDASFVLIDLLSKAVSRKKFANLARSLKYSNKQNLKYILVRDIWQIFYLGSEEFEKSEKREAFFENSNPLRFQEKLLISFDLLKQITKRGIKLAIATSRPRQEAIYALKRFNLEKYFPRKYLVALEDVQKEKPFPDSLIEAVRRMKVKNPIFIGDTINDCLAAKKAKIACIYIGKAKLGDFQLEDINRIGEVIKI